MKIHFRDCVPYDEHDRPIDPDCDASYKDYIRPICDFFDNVCDFNVAPSIVDFLSTKKYVKFVCYDSNAKDIDDYTLTVENGKVVDVYVNHHKCYAIQFENRTYPGTEILFEEGIFESKEEAVGRIREMAEQICQERGMVIKDWTHGDDIDIFVQYESCDKCPEYGGEDSPCIGECMMDDYNFTLVEYVFHKKGE